LRLIALVGGVALLVSACSDEDLVSPGGPSAGGDTSGGAATGPGLSVSEARASRPGRTVLVSGFVVAEGDHVRLCEALAESYPPQCGGAFLEVRGLDVSAMPGVETVQDVRWTPRARQLLGEVSGGTLSVTGTTKG